MNVEALRSQLARYRGFLAQDSGNISLVTEVANLHLRLGEFVPARELLEQTLSQTPAQPSLLSLLASVAMASGDYPRAIELLKGLAEVGQNDPVIHYNLAYAYLYAQQPENSKSELLKIESPGEKFPQALLLLAQAEHFLGELDNAFAHAKEYLVKYPEDAGALSVLSLLNLDMDNAAAAREAAEKTLATNENDLNALVTMGSLALGTQDAGQAGGFFEKAVEHHPKSGRSWSGLGLTSMLKLDLKKATEELQLAVKYMPGHIGTWHTLAWCQLLQDDVAGAEASFNKSMEIDRAFGETHGGLAVIYVLQNKLDQADAAAKRAIRLNRNSFAGRFAQSLMVNKTDPAKAQEIIRQILASSPVPDAESLQDTLKRMTKNLPKRPPAN